MGKSLITCHSPAKPVAIKKGMILHSDDDCFARFLVVSDVGVSGVVINWETGEPVVAFPAIFYDSSVGPNGQSYMRTFVSAEGHYHVAPSGNLKENEQGD